MLRCARSLTPVITQIISSFLRAAPWQEFCTNKGHWWEGVTLGITPCHTCPWGEKLRVAVLLCASSSAGPPEWRS